MAESTMSHLQNLSPEYLAEDGSNELIVVGIVLIIVQALVFIGYIASRLLHGQSSTWITWALFIAGYISVLSLTITVFYGVDIGGMGRHIEYHQLTSPAVIRQYLKIRTAIEYLYMAAITFPKLMICTLYLAVFVDTSVRRLTWAVVIILVLYFVAGLITISTLCIPFARNWDPAVEGVCGDRMATYRYIAIPGIITDLAILVLPLSMIWRLQVGRAKKAGIFLTFLTGSLGIVVAIIRTTEFFTVDFRADPTYTGITTISLTIAEPSAYFICACLPGMRPLVVLLARKSGLLGIAQTTIRASKQVAGAGRKEGSASTALGEMRESRVSPVPSEDRSGLLGREEEWKTGSVEHELYGRPNRQ